MLIICYTREGATYSKNIMKQITETLKSYLSEILFLLDIKKRSMTC